MSIKTGNEILGNKPKLIQYIKNRFNGFFLKKSIKLYFLTRGKIKKGE